MVTDSPVNEVIKLLSSLNLSLDNNGLDKMKELIDNFQSDEQLRARYGFATSRPAQSVAVRRKETFSSFVSCGFSIRISEHAEIKQNLIDLEVVTPTDFNQKDVLTKNATAIILHRIFEEFKDVEPCVSGNTFSIPTEHSLSFLKKFKNYKSIHWPSIQKDDGFNMNYDTLNVGREVWNWKDISASKKIRWDEYLITEFADLIDWNYFSGNDSIKWDYWFIDKHSDRINFKLLSANKSLALNEEQFYRYVDKWNLAALAKNPSFFWSYELVSRFFPKVMDKNEQLYENNIEISLLKYGRFDFKIIDYHFDAFDRTFETHHWVRRNSDGYHDYTNTYSLWDIISSNPNIHWSCFLFNKYFSHLNLRSLAGKVHLNIDTIDQYWDYVIPFAYSDQESYDGYRDELPRVRLMEYLKNSEIINLTIEKFLANEIKWWGTFNSDKFLNQSIAKILSAHLSS